MLLRLTHSLPTRSQPVEIRVLYRDEDDERVMKLDKFDTGVVVAKDVRWIVWNSNFATLTVEGGDDAE